MSRRTPRLDRASLARLGMELQAAHYRSERPALSERLRDLLLEWAIAEAVNAAHDEQTAANYVDATGGQRTNPLLPLEPPQAPQPIATAPRAMAEGELPVLLLLYCPEFVGWHTGYWWAERWYAHLNADVELFPTHWLPPMLGPRPREGETQALA